MNQSYISSEFVDYTSAANLINKNALHSSGANDRNASNNNIFYSGKLEQSKPQETSSVTVSNNCLPQNVFSQQQEAKPDAFSHSSQSNNYKNYGMEDHENKSHNTTGLGVQDSKISYGDDSKINDMSYDRPSVP